MLDGHGGATDMAQIPFIGPTYNLDSRPASVQRTINLIPYPQEPGNERTRWVFKDVPGLVAYAPYVGPSVISLLHFDGTDGSATVIDEVATNTWAIAGPGTLSTANAKWGSAGYNNPLFTGPGPVSDDPLPALGLSDYTIEIWFKTTAATTMYLWDFNGPSDLCLTINAGQLSFTSTTLALPVGNSLIQTTGAALNDGAWHFVQIIRDTLIVSMNVDGALIGTSDDPRDYPAQVVGIGGLATGATTLQFIGALDDFRLSLGVQPSTVPTGPFTLT